MSAPLGATEEVDWAAVERRGRRTDVVVALCCPAFFASLFLLTGRMAFWEGTAGWVAVGVLSAPIAVSLLVTRARPRSRALAAEGHRIRYAVRHSADPGEGLRERADVQARYLASVRWFGWLMPLGPLGVLLSAEWGRPLVAVPGAVVLLVVTVLFLVWWSRQSAAARHWMAHPPGPPRELPPLTRAERWLSGRRLVWLVAGVLVLSTAAIVLALLVS